MLQYERKKRKCNMKRFITINRGDEESKRLCKYIRETMVKKNFTIDEKNPELIIYVGGDGTLLKAFHEYLDILDNVSLVGIHTGTLGFSTDYTAQEVEEFLENIDSDPVIEEKQVLEVECYNTLTSKHYYALNEVRVENIVKTQAMDLYLDNTYFETFRGNGVCISAQYGSTAYNRSIGGAVIYPGLELLQVTEISGIHHRHSRSLGAPLIMNPNIQVTLKSDSFDHALLCYDHLHIHLDDIHEIRVRNSDKRMKFAHFKEISHIDRLNALF